jgi:2-polyprenyl-6-methoxyphenol hydroxylase-like FAD-dependent oxidoreductase
VIDRCDVAIVGGGPVGLLLGCMLVQRGLDVRVIERSDALRAHSRAVGVHPPGLSCLAEVGVAEPLIARGVRVRQAFAFGSKRALGRVSFDRLPGPYPFVLCVPQCETEQALERRLSALSESALLRGREVLSIAIGSGESRLVLRADGEQHALAARFVVGCDGKHSQVRSGAGIAFPGGRYREHFVMADVVDETPFEQNAAVFLTRSGVVESFPLPGRVRRWVVGLREHACTPSAELVERLVFERTGQLARAATATMVSAFTAEHHLAERFVQGRLALAGDAAHVLSPIGGQGMNLGWLDAKLLASTLCEALRTPQRADALLHHYARARRAAARSATRRAALFMSIGQSRHLLPLRDAVVQGLLSRRLVAHTAQLFTMRGLASRPA